MAPKRIRYFVLMWLAGFAGMVACLAVAEVVPPLGSTDSNSYGVGMAALLILWGIASWKAARDTRFKQIVLHYLKLYAIIGLLGTWVLIRVLHRITTRITNGNDAYIPNWWIVLSVVILACYIAGGLLAAYGITGRRFPNLGGTAKD